jgi:hypothetical protein
VVASFLKSYGERDDRIDISGGAVRSEDYTHVWELLLASREGVRRVRLCNVWVSRLGGYAALTWGYLIPWRLGSDAQRRMLPRVGYDYLTPIGGTESEICLR